MSRKKVKYFNDPVYGFVYFVFAGDKDKRYVKNLLKGKFDFDPGRDTLAQTFYIPGVNFQTKDYKNIVTFTGVWFSERFFQKPKAVQNGIIAHECYHLLERTLPNIGVAVQYGEFNEHMAYYLTFLIENYFNNLFDV